MSIRPAVDVYGIHQASSFHPANGYSDASGLHNLSIRVRFGFDMLYTAWVLGHSGEPSCGFGGFGTCGRKIGIPFPTAKNVFHFGDVLVLNTSFLQHLNVRSPFDHRVQVCVQTGAVSGSNSAGVPVIVLFDGPVSGRKGKAALGDIFVTSCSTFAFWSGFGFQFLVR